MSPIRWEEADAVLLGKVRALQTTHKKWSTAHQEIIDFRERLLIIQNYRCAYCQGTIESTANGYVELDHVLPKAPNGNKADRMDSDNFEDRLVTRGYAQFMYEPLNLVITCRACNSAKNSFDPLSNRKKLIDNYPSEENATRDIQWYHPHFHEYEKHITRTPEWTFVEESPQGDFTIRACKLHIPEQLNKRFQARAAASLVHSPNIRIAIIALATSIVQKRYGIEQGVHALVQRCQLTNLEARELIDAWMNHVQSDSPEVYLKANQALQSVAIIWEGKVSFDASSNELVNIGVDASKLGE